MNSVKEFNERGSSSDYVPVLLVQNSGGSQVKSFMLSQNFREKPKPDTESLKQFYENSGKLENISLNKTDKIFCKPNILKKPHNNAVGNCLKLTSFLTPRNGINKPIAKYMTNENSILKQQIVTGKNVKNVESKFLTVERKLVKLDNPDLLTNSTKTIIKSIVPKTDKPKLVNKSNDSTDLTKHTSVQLLKVGGTYHSLNQLSDNQKKIVDQALKKIKHTDKVPLEPTYDPVTNTKIIYKIVSPRDLTIVGNDKIVLKEKKNFKIEEETAIKVYTRSGRQIKVPKPKVEPNVHDQKPKRKNASIHCFQCCAEFQNKYRLHKHYEENPTHIQSKIHSSLFNCLLAIIRNGPDQDRAEILVQQLEQFISKIQSILPCLLNKVDDCEGVKCTINENIGRMFEMEPGNYNFNMEALSCLKDNNGYCIHNPQIPKQTQSEIPTSQQFLKNTNKEDINKYFESEGCARINSVDKLPSVTKRILKLKLKRTQKNITKKMRLNSECDTLIDLGNDDNSTISLMNAPQIPFVPLTSNVSEKSNDNQVNSHIPEIHNDNQSPFYEESSLINELDKNINNGQNSLSLDSGIHKQFHSSHFDIRSSPIKPSASVFQKFQINPNVLKFDIQPINPLNSNTEKTVTNINLVDETETNINLTEETVQEITMEKSNILLQEVLQHNNELNHEIVNLEKNDIPTETSSQMCSNSPDLHDLIFKSNTCDIACKESNIVLSFDNCSSWDLNTIANDQSQDSFMKSNNLIEPSFLNVNDDSIDKSALNQTEHLNVSKEDAGQAVLNFLESLGNDLNYPETELQNNTVDFSIDLFSFNTT